MKRKNVSPIILTAILFLMVIHIAANTNPNKRTYTVVDTGQTRCYDNIREIPYPRSSNQHNGQDAQYESNPPAYHDNGDGSVTDRNTGLMWQKTPDFVKRTLSESQKYADKLVLAGHSDWRLPTIKELFSIADFRGNIRTRTPYIDTRYFDFRYPDTSKGWRIIDAQYRSSTRYQGLIMHDTRGVFGFNFADGRIKAYPEGTRGAGRQFVRCVRAGNTLPAYGKNDFVDKGNGTITDKATGLTWVKKDSGQPMTWQQALSYAEKLNYAGHDDWRLPNVKELQSIIDYSRAPDARNRNARSAAINPLFSLTEMESWFWTSTTHVETGGAYYVCFGQAFSAWMFRGKKMNAHGAGAVRSDPKTGDPGIYVKGKGPQGDQVRIYNYVRCVRGGNVRQNTSGPAVQQTVRQRFSRKPANKKKSHQKRFISRLDKDKDGKVSLTEFDGPKHHFQVMDVNKDGYVSEKEAPRFPPRRRR